MVDLTRRNLTAPSDLPPLSAAQRAFVEGAEVLRATAPATARALAELPRLSSAELDVLVESGLVREASDSRFYVFRTRTDAPTWHAAGHTAAGHRRGPWTLGPYWRTFLFWLVLILIPILLLQLTARG
jgi:hypothetical protein